MVNGETFRVGAKRFGSLPERMEPPGPCLAWHDGAMATKKRKPAAKGMDAATIKLRNQRWQEARGRYREAQGGEAEGWDQRYEALGEILDDQLYLAGGYRTAAAFLAAEAPGLSLDSARQYVEVARHFDPADEVRFGISKLALLVAYLKAQAGGLLPLVKVHPDRQKIVLADGKRRRTIAFSGATAEQLRAAIRGAHHAAGTTRPQKKPAAVVAMETGLRRARARGARVRARKDSIDLLALPLATLGPTLKTLAAVRLPRP